MFVAGEPFDHEEDAIWETQPSKLLVEMMDQQPIVLRARVISCGIGGRGTHEFKEVEHRFTAGTRDSWLWSSTTTTSSPTRIETLYDLLNQFRRSGCCSSWRNGRRLIRVVHGRD